MKRNLQLIRSKIIIILLTAFFGINSLAQKETMFIAGIEVNNLSLDTKPIRTALYSCFVQSEKYTLNDRYDVAEKLDEGELIGCLGKSCLQRVGKKVGANQVVAFTFDGLTDRIIVSSKIVDVSTGKILKNSIAEFENQPRMINRIIELSVFKLLDIEVNEDVAKQLNYKKTPAQSKQLAILNNSGPRIGVAYVFGDNGDVLARKESEGGLAADAAILNLGYQFETQYVGTDNFSGLFEFIFNVGGLEKATIIPSFALLNGFRFGKGNWEIATGPSLTLKKLASGTMKDNRWILERDLMNEGFTFDDSEIYTRPDMRGKTVISSNWVVGIGKTFRVGSVNLPVNAYASINKYGTAFGLSLGLNVSK